jgi:hypothetical protein
MTAHEDFCKRCGRSYAEDDKHLDVDLDDATDYIFDRLLERGTVVDRMDIVQLIQMFVSYTDQLQEE